MSGDEGASDGVRNRQHRKKIIRYTNHMFPVLFQLGPVVFQTFSLFLVLAFFACGYVFWKKGKEEHYAEDELFDVFLLSLFWGALWSRIGFIIFHFSHFGLNPLKWIDIFSSPGLIPLFGVIASSLYIHRTAKKQRWNTFEVLDFAAIAISLGSAIIWLGAFFDGSGFGHATTLPWGLSFPGVFDRRHPTQLYGFALFAVLSFCLSWLEYRYRTFEWYRDTKHSAQTGFLFAVFCMFYGIFGSILGFLMPPQMVVMGFPLDIPVRIAFFIFGALTLYVRSGRSLLPWKK